MYQDLYGEGSFTGKGIYDVEAFERATAGRFPENTLLSHDLIEGSYARAGLATDVMVYDDYPTRYLTFTRRKHRWIRGDWQLLDWLSSRVPGPDGPERNRLSLLSRWKILDNLRRSVVEIAQLVFLVVGWTVLPGSPLRWTVLGLLAIAAHWIVSLLLALVRPPLDKSWRAYYATVGLDAMTSVQQIALAVAFLPHQAWVSADAIVRTLWRLFVTKRYLLEWQTASQTERMSGSRGATWRTMWPAVALTAGILGLVVAVRWGTGGRPPDWNLVAGRLHSSWCGCFRPPSRTRYNAPPVRRERRLPSSRRADALRYALAALALLRSPRDRRDQSSGPGQRPGGPRARRRDADLAHQHRPPAARHVSACDLGFITAADMTERLELVFRTLERLRRFRGHFYNWYDLETLSVLEPAYISTVDSGNLAGHLIALRQACLEIRARAPVVDRTWHALDAALAIVAERLNAFAGTLASGVCRCSSACVAARAHLLDARSAVSAAGMPGGTASLETIVDPDARMQRGARRRRAGSHRVDRLVPPTHPRSRGVRPAAARRDRHRRATRGHRGTGVRLCDGDGLPLPVRRQPKAVLDRISAGHATRSTPRTTICSHPKRAWPASSPWQRETCRSITGSGSGAR